MKKEIIPSSNRQVKDIKKLLFVCNLNRNRSRTAEDTLKDNENYEVSSAGILEDSVKKLTRQDLEWADMVFVFEERQRKWIAENFPTEYLKKKIITLNIPDIYDYMHPELVRLIKERLKDNGVKFH